MAHISIVGRDWKIFFKMEVKQQKAQDYQKLSNWLLPERGKEKMIDGNLKCLFAVGMEWNGKLWVERNRKGKGKYPGGVFIIIFVIINLPDDDVILWCGDMKELSFAPWYGDIRKSLWYLYEASVACGCVAAASPAKSNLYA